MAARITRTLSRFWQFEILMAKLSTDQIIYSIVAGPALAFGSYVLSVLAVSTVTLWLAQKTELLWKYMPEIDGDVHAYAIGILAAIPAIFITRHFFNAGWPDDSRYKSKIQNGPEQNTPERE